MHEGEEKELKIGAIDILSHLFGIHTKMSSSSYNDSEEGGPKDEEEEKEEKKKLYETSETIIRLTEAERTAHINMRDNPTTGYTTRIASFDKDLIDVSKESSTMDKARVPRSGGTITFRISLKNEVVVSTPILTFLTITHSRSFHMVVDQPETLGFTLYPILISSSS